MKQKLKKSRRAKIKCKALDFIQGWPAIAVQRTKKVKLEMTWASGLISWVK